MYTNLNGHIGIVFSKFSFIILKWFSLLRKLNLKIFKKSDLLKNTSSISLPARSGKNKTNTKDKMD